MQKVAHRKWNHWFLFSNLGMGTLLETVPFTSAFLLERHRLLGFQGRWAASKKKRNGRGSLSGDRVSGWACRLNSYLFMELKAKSRQKALRVPAHLSGPWSQCPCLGLALLHTCNHAPTVPWGIGESLHLRGT